MNAEQNRIIDELFEVAECAARAGVSIFVAVGQYSPGDRANFRSRISVQNDHQAMDLMREITDAWSRANHRDATPCI